MPNGKTMRECTGTYVATVGGQFAEAGSLPADNVMGAVFTDDSIREFINAA